MPILRERHPRPNHEGLALAMHGRLRTGYQQPPVQTPYQVSHAVTCGGTHEAGHSASESARDRSDRARNWHWNITGSASHERHTGTFEMEHTFLILLGNHSMKFQLNLEPPFFHSWKCVIYIYTYIHLCAMLLLWYNSLDSIDDCDASVLHNLNVNIV